MSLNTTPRTWVAGEVVTAAHMNTEVRDAVTGIQAAWSTWTPTYTNITVGNGTVTAKYHRVGKDIRGYFLFTAGSSSSFGAGNLLVTLPVTALTPPNTPLGPAFFVDSGSSGTRTIGAAIMTSSATAFFVTNATGGTVTNTVPWAWGNTDLLGFEFMYEAA